MLVRMVCDVVIHPPLQEIYHEHVKLLQTLTGIEKGCSPMEETGLSW
jgi:hypothetical protein